MGSPAVHGERRAYVDVSLGQVHLRTAGDGPPVLLLHQSPSSSVQFERATPLLVAAGFSTIAMDTPGFGMSDPPRGGPPRIEDYAAVVVEVLDALGLDRVALVGHHTGATIGWELAGAHPERVSELIVSGAGLYTAEERAGFQARALEEQLDLRSDGSHLLQMWERGRRHVATADDLYVKQRAFVQLVMAGEHAWYGHHAAFQFDPEHRVRTVTCPIMILTNTGDIIHRQALRTAAMRPDAQLVVLEGGTHDIIDQQPVAWVGAIVDFLRGS